MFPSRYLWIFLFVIFFVLELTLARNIVFFQTSPDLMLILVVFAGLRQGILYGAILGFAGGLTKDIFFSAFPGLGAFSLTLIGSLSGLFSRRIFYQNVFLQVLIIFIATFLKMALANRLLIIIHHSPYDVKAVISQAFYNALLTPALFYLLESIFKNKR